MAESVVLFDSHVLFSPKSNHNQCHDSLLWQSWYTRTRTAVFAVFVLYYLMVVPMLFFISRRRVKSPSNILAWYTFAPASFFAFMWVALALIADVYLNCLKISGITYLQVFAAVNVFRFLTSIIMLGITLLPIPITILRQAGMNTQYTKIAHSTLLIVVFMLGLVHTTIWNLNNLHMFTREDQIPKKTESAIAGAYYLLYLCASLAAGAQLVISVSAMRTKGLSSGGLFPFGIALAISQIAFALVDVCALFSFQVVRRNYMAPASAAVCILSLFFQACVFAFVCLVAQSRALESGRLRSVDESNTKETATTPRWSRKFSI